MNVFCVLMSWLVVGGTQVALGRVCVGGAVCQKEQSVIGNFNPLIWLLNRGEGLSLSLSQLFNPSWLCKGASVKPLESWDLESFQVDECIHMP